ncbi:MAG: hypothetical protein CMN30_05870 [Sandaracinus sp.]|nr:hypothetical protein [Sandaracinus sp.]
MTMKDADLASLALALAEAATPAAVGEAIAECTGSGTWLLATVDGETLTPLASAPEPPGPEVAYKAPDATGELADPEAVSPRLGELAGAAQGALHLHPLSSQFGEDALFVTDQALDPRALTLLGAAVERLQGLDTDPSLFRDRALSTISHDLRGPLNVIGFASSMLQSTVGDAEKELVAKVRRAARTMEGMIRDLLDLGELEAGRLEMRLADVPMKTILGHLRAHAEPLAENAGVTFAIENADGDAPVHADASRLAQALGLLVDGACKHAKKGSVTVRASVVEGVPTFDVEDTGTSLDAQTRGALFRPTSRGAEPHPRAKGLALTLARRLIEAHGGTLEAVESDGVCVRVQLATA